MHRSPRALHTHGMGGWIVLPFLIMEVSRQYCKSLQNVRVSGKTNSIFYLDISKIFKLDSGNLIFSTHFCNAWNCTAADKND